VKRRSFLTGISAAIATGRFPAAFASRSRFLVYLGTRDEVRARGIYRCSFDPATGNCGAVSLAADLTLPTALAISADARYLYSVSEVGNDGKTNGALAAYAIDRPSGDLKLLNQVSSGGGGPTDIALDRTGRTAVVANFGTGRTTAFRLLPDGRLGDQTASMAHFGSGPHRRQAAPHAHSVTFSPDNHFVFVPDLGADRVFIFCLDAATGALSSNDPPFISLPAGSGPRHMVIHPSGRFVYLMCELTARIVVFTLGRSTGTLSEIQTISALANGAPGEPSGAGIAMHPGGRFLYTTTRNDSAVEMFSIDRAKGTLLARQNLPSRGKGPWSCIVDPHGWYLFAMNQASDSAAIFRLDRGTGILRPTGDLPSVPAPVCATFVLV
jgi:6-phosphogluconolactonase